MEIRERASEIICITHFLPRNPKDDMATRAHQIDKMRVWAVQQRQYKLDVMRASFMAEHKPLHRPQQQPLIMTMVYGYFPRLPFYTMGLNEFLQKHQEVTPEEVRFIFNGLQ